MIDVASWAFYFPITFALFLLRQALKEKELGNSAYKNKDFEVALKHYEEAIKHDPTNMTYISNKAGISHRATHTEAAAQQNMLYRGENVMSVLNFKWTTVGPIWLINTC